MFSAGLAWSNASGLYVGKIFQNDPSWTLLGKQVNHGHIWDGIAAFRAVAKGTVVEVPPSSPDVSLSRWGGNTGPGPGAMGFLTSGRWSL